MSINKFTNDDSFNYFFLLRVCAELCKTVNTDKILSGDGSDTIEEIQEMIKDFVNDIIDKNIQLCQTKK